MKRFIPLVWLLLCSSIFTFGQIDVTFPQARMVFQRDNNNSATIAISGNYTQNVDVVEAHLVAIQGGNSTDWVQQNLNAGVGIFRGTIQATGGWYRLELRAKYNGQIVANATVEKVGIGEVFVVAGQSNASGIDNYGNVGANDDRVNCVSNYYNSSRDYSDPPYPQINQLSANIKIAPYGNGSWCWGKLGDLLAERLNVPILFMNSAWQGSSSAVWKISSDETNGSIHTNPYIPLSYPYNNLRKSLQYYVSMFGIRSVLWHQGEADNDANTNAITYKNNLEYIINKTRAETGKNISWVVSRASRVNNTIAMDVIQGQNLAIQQVNNVFAGPETDIILDRVDGVHFYGNSLITLANAWFNSLNSNYFNTSIPSLATTPLTLQLNCNTNNISLTMPSGFSAYSWSNGEANAHINVAVGGSLSGKTRDNYGNVYFLPQFNIDNPIIPAKPILSTNGPTTFCDGSSIIINSNTQSKVYWNNGVSINALTVSTAGDYYATAISKNGCKTVSDITKVSVNPTPTAIVTVEGPTTFCYDKSVKLSSNASSGNYWNNGSNAQSITVNQSNNYVLTVTNEFGCSRSAAPIGVTVYPQPTTPNIIADGPTTFCSDKSVTLSTSTLANGYEWSNGVRVASTKTNQSGNYTLKITDNNGCHSAQSNIIVVASKAIPANPSVVQTGTYTLEQNTTGSPIAQSFDWFLNNNKISAQTAKIKVKQMGNYVIKGFIDYPYDGNNHLLCYSETSKPYSYTFDLNNKGASFFPNPNDLGYINIETYDDIENAEVTIYSLRGFPIRSIFVPKFNDRHTLDLQSLPKGDYLLQVKSDIFNVTKHIILN